ncbi:MAG: hypothetical protein KC620_27315, partial [Myxococcales bacterium]|nr:hypothetical protein [Myxococcales bacterium]
MSQNGCEYACVPSNEGVEACDQLDNDCNGVVDDPFDLQRDPLHCGACDNVCAFENGRPGCVAGRCALAGCAAGFVDADGDPANGCELRCTPTPDPTEVCDTVDNDCDGSTDEGFDLANDEANCGACGVLCNPANATGQCRGGRCFVSACAPGFIDLDRGVQNGCEYACVESEDGIEVCNT